jgi:exodeoxyribonuclease VII large subunit
LRRLAQEQLDVIVIVRGGGARSDLAPFDTEMVARAITEMPVPVLTGIGHETDRTIADEVAHTSLKTPTATAALLVDLVNDYVERLADVTHRVSLRARAVCAVAQRELSGVARRLTRVVPASLDRELRMLDAHRRRAAESGQRGARRAAEAVDGRHDRVVAGARRLARVEQVRVDGAAARLRALDPRRVLERGYTITRDAQGRAVRVASAAAAGALLVTETADGEIRSRVEDA